MLTYFLKIGQIGFRMSGVTFHILYIFYKLVKSDAEWAIIPRYRPVHKFKKITTTTMRWNEIRAILIMVVDSSISMMSVLLWMGSGVAVEAYPWFTGSATCLTNKVGTRNLLNNRIQCFICLAFLSLFFSCFCSVILEWPYSLLYWFPPGCSVLG